MMLRRVVWLALAIAVVAAVLGLRAHTQRDPQCDVGFTCAQVDHLSWTGTDRSVGGLCARVTLAADVTTMFRQSQWAGFRRTASQRSNVLPTGATVTITPTCDAKGGPASPAAPGAPATPAAPAGPAPPAYTEAWLDYVVATDRDALTKAESEANRVRSDPTRATVVRGRDANWLFTVARVPADTGTLTDGFAPELILPVPSHWSQELGELRLPCVWVTVEGSVLIGDTSFPLKVMPGDTPQRVCAPGRGMAWFDKLDGYFDNPS